MRSRRFRRPAAGDAGLVASTWHPSWESYGSTQLQRRFEKEAGRYMSDVDYHVWLAVRTDVTAFARYLRALEGRHVATGREVFLVLDNGPCHTSRASRAALARTASRKIASPIKTS